MGLIPFFRAVSLCASKEYHSSGPVSILLIKKIIIYIFFVHYAQKACKEIYGTTSVLDIHSEFINFSMRSVAVMRWLTEYE